MSRLSNKRGAMLIKTNILRRALFLLIPILVGIGIFFFLIKTKQGPPQKQKGDTQRKVRIIEVTPMDVTPKTHGYGTVQPTKVWQAVAEVSGKIKYINPALTKGQSISKGTLLVEFDPTEYKLSVSEAKANIKSIDAQIKQLKDKEQSNKELLKLEQDTLEIKQKELGRQKKLVKDDISSTSDYEQTETDYIGQKYKVQALENTLVSLESEFLLLRAQKEQAEIKLESALLQLAYTRIKAPFNGIISAVNVERSQFVQKGQTIAEADSIDSVEIEAQISNGLYVFRTNQNQDMADRLFKKGQPLGEALGISAIIKPTTGRHQTSWEGKVMRFNASIDTKTRTPGIIIQVDNPFLISGKELKRPLIKGMYCEVELIGQPFKNRLVIPRTAIHENNRVYIVNSENKLMFKTVNIGFSQDSFSLIRSGLDPGDKVIITDIVPAVEGMTVFPVIDERVTQQLKTDVAGGVK